MNNTRTALRAAAGLLLALVMAAVSLQAAENVNVTVSKIKDLNIRFYGFVETDYTRDTTEPAFIEEAGNNAIPMRTTASGGSGAATGVQNYAGQHSRNYMSVRNSRLGFDLTVPKTDSGIDTEGVIE